WKLLDRSGRPKCAATRIKRRRQRTLEASIMPRNIKSIAIVFAGLLGVALNLPSQRSEAQNALGSGNALDSNLNATSGRINAAQKVENFADRNLIVTGDVAGGRGFRGSVGYTASQDF